MTLKRTPIVIPNIYNTYNSYNEVKMKVPRKHNNINNNSITEKDNTQHMTQIQKKKDNKTAQQIQTHHVELKMMCVI